MNKIFLIGNLTKDPEVRTTSTGKKVASFGIAVNEGKDATGNEMVQYFNLSAWDKKAEIVELYVKKGHKVAIVGRLVNESWDKADGTKAYGVKIVVSDLELLTSKHDAERMTQNQGSSPSSSTSNSGGSSSSKSSKAVDKHSDEDLPEIDVDSLNVQMPF